MKIILYPFSNMAISPPVMKKKEFYSSKLYGLTGVKILLLVFCN